MTTLRKLPMQAPRANTNAGKNQGCAAATSARGPVIEAVLTGSASVAKSLRGRLPHDGSRFRGGKLRPDLKGLRPLVHQHAQAVGEGQAERLRLREEPGLGRVVDHVVHGGDAGKGREVDGGRLAGLETDARRVDHDGALRQALR